MLCVPSLVARHDFVDSMKKNGGQLGTSEVVRVAVNARRGLASVLTTKPWRMTLLGLEDEGDEDGEGAEGIDHSMDQS